MRGAWKLQLSYAAELMETYSFPRRDPAFIRDNYEATCRLIEGLGAPQPDRRQKYFWRDVPVENVLDFLSEYRTLQRNIEPAKLTEYIRKQNEKGFIVTWTVVLMEADRDVNPLFDFPIDGETVAVRSTYRRQAGSDKIVPAKLTEYVIPKAHIISPRHEYLDLSKEQFDRALGATQARRPKATIPAGDDVREKRPDSHALLLLYPLDPDPAGYPREEAPVIGYAISFPAINGEDKVEYMGNQQLLQEFESPDDDYLDAQADQEIMEDSND